MPLTRYVSNKNPADPVGAIKVASKDGVERVLERGGAPVDLTDAEVAQLSGRYELEAVEESEAEDGEPKTVDVSPATASSFVLGGSPSPSPASSQSGASTSSSTPGLGS